MNRKTLLVLILIICLMYFMNIVTPLLADDYYSVFVWDEGNPINSELPEDAKRITGLADFLKSIKTYYLTWGGRIPGGIPVGVFALLGKEYFNPVNTLMVVALVTEIYWLSHEGKISFNFDASYIFWIFFSLWAFNIGFIDTVLWLGGSCNYLWMEVIVLTFLIPYVQNYFNADLLSQDSRVLTAGLFVLGILAGWSHETTTCWIILIMFYWIYLCKKSNNLQNWKVSGFVGFCIGYVLLIFAPGNFVRYQMQHHHSIFLVNSLLQAKILETKMILFFHLFLWCFIIYFLFRYRKKFNNEIIKPYLNLAKGCIIVALGSIFIMFFFTGKAMRPSFLSLVYLLIASASLFRVQQITGVSVINNKVKSFFKALGHVYFFVTVIVSITGNYLNWKQWDSVFLLIKQEQKNPTHNVLTIKPAITDNNIYWFAGSGFFHIVGFPVTGNDKNYNNVTFSKYYNIKGIKVLR